MRDIRTAIYAGSVHSKVWEPLQKQIGDPRRKMQPSIGDNNEWPDQTKNGPHSWFHQDANATGPFRIEHY